MLNHKIMTCILGVLVGMLLRVSGWYGVKGGHYGLSETGMQTYGRGQDNARACGHESPRANTHTYMNYMCTCGERIKAGGAQKTHSEGDTAEHYECEDTYGREGGQPRSWGPPKSFMGGVKQMLAVMGRKTRTCTWRKKGTRCPKWVCGGTQKIVWMGHQTNNTCTAENGGGWTAKKFWKGMCQQQICKDIGELESSWGGRRNTKYTNQTQDTNKINIHAQNYKTVPKKPCQTSRNQHRQSTNNKHAKTN